MSRRCRRGVAVFVFGLVLVSGFLTNNSYGVPARSRKHKLDCAVCHYAAQMPRLNGFGERFRMLGYRIPDEIIGKKERPEEENTYSKLGIRPDQYVYFVGKVNAESGDKKTTNIEAAEFYLGAAGTIDDHFSFFTTVEAKTGGVIAMEDVWLMWINTPTKDFHMSARAGYFYPLWQLRGGAALYRTTRSRPLAMDSAVGNGNPFKLRDRQQGVELGLYPGPYAVHLAVVTGNGDKSDNNNSKDFIAQVQRRFDDQGSSLGAYYYSGRARVVPTGSPAFNDNFERIGAFGNYTSRSVDIMVSGIWGYNHNATNRRLNNVGYFLQVDPVIVKDRLLGIVRYDYWDPDTSVRRNETHGPTVGLSYKLRDNVKLVIEGHLLRAAGLTQNFAEGQLYFAF